MVDKIIIEGLELNTVIGVYDWERVDPQRVFVDVELDYSLEKAGISDQVTDTIDYATIAKLVDDTAKELKPELVEALAHHSCLRILESYPVDAVNIKITKPDILDRARNVGVQVRRTRRWFEELHLGK